MKTINSIKGQTVSDIAIQEYGNISAIFKLIEDNPQLAGQNVFPIGYVVDVNADFDLSYPIIAGTEINITENYTLSKPNIVKQLDTVVSE